MSSIDQTINEVLEPQSNEVDLYGRWSWGEDPTSGLAERIINAYFNDVSMIIIIHGDPRIGKSGYAYKVAMMVYNFIFGIRDLFRIYDLTMGYDPLEVLETWRSIKRPTCVDPLFRENKLPMYIWDDGGVYLFYQDFNKPEIKAIMKYFQIVFTKIQCIVLTTPTPKVITAGIRAMPSAVWIEVRRKKENDRLLAVHPPSIRYGREARIYYPFTTPDLSKTHVWKGFHDNFDCRFPDPVYNVYNPRREDYVTDIEDELVTETRLKVAKRHKQRKKTLSELNKISNDLYG